MACKMKLFASLGGLKYGIEYSIMILRLTQKGNEIKPYRGICAKRPSSFVRFTLQKKASCYNLCPWKSTRKKGFIISLAW